MPALSSGAILACPPLAGSDHIIFSTPQNDGLFFLHAFVYAAVHDVVLLFPFFFLFLVLLSE